VRRHTPGHGLRVPQWRTLGSNTVALDRIALDVLIGGFVRRCRRSRRSLGVGRSRGVVVRLVVPLAQRSLATPRAVVRRSSPERPSSETFAVACPDSLATPSGGAHALGATMGCLRWRTAEELSRHLWGLTPHRPNGDISHMKTTSRRWRRAPPPYRMRIRTLVGSPAHTCRWSGQPGFRPLEISAQTLRSRSDRERWQGHAVTPSASRPGHNTLWAGKRFA